MVAPITAGVEKIIPPWFAHTALSPLIVLIVSTCGFGSTEIALQLEELVPQSFCAVTHTLPDVTPKVTVMLCVPAPLVIVAPGGNVQL